MNARLNNLLKGTFSGVWHWIIKITIPIFIFNYLMQLSIMGIQLYTEEKVALITYWIIAFGLISTGVAVFVGSSPKYSVRHAIGSLLMLVTNGFYLYVYKFSGAVDFRNISLTVGAGITATFSLNMDVMIYMNMGLIGLNIIIILWDLVISIVSPIEKKQKIKHTQKTKNVNHPVEDKRKRKQKEKDRTGLEEYSAYSF